MKKEGHTNIFDAERDDREAKSSKFLFRSAEKRRTASSLFTGNVGLKLRYRLVQQRLYRGLEINANEESLGE